MLRRTLTVFAILAVSLTAQAQKERHLAFHYAFTVKDVPAGKEVRVWFRWHSPTPTRTSRCSARKGI